jgi:hypothetical protein
MVAAVGCSRTKADPYAEEVRGREAFTKKTLFEADAGRALNVASTSEVQFDEGFGLLSYEKDRDDGHPSITNHAFRWMGQNAHIRLKTHGSHPMKLIMAGWVNRKVVQTSPVIDLYIDGIYVGSCNPVGESGHYWIETTVPDWALRRPWVNLVARVNAVGFHWEDPPRLMVVNVYRFSWTEADVR